MVFEAEFNIVTNYVVCYFAGNKVEHIRIAKYLSLLKPNGSVFT